MNKVIEAVELNEASRTLKGPLGEDRYSVNKKIGTVDNITMYSVRDLALADANVILLVNDTNPSLMVPIKYENIRKMLTLFKKAESYVGKEKSIAPEEV